MSVSDFVESYKTETLDQLDPVAVYKELVRRYGEAATLVCYEKPSDFCHRRVVARWLEEANSVDIPELGVPLLKNGLFRSK